MILHGQIYRKNDNICLIVFTSCHTAFFLCFLMNLREDLLRHKEQFDHIFYKSAFIVGGLIMGHRFLPFQYGKSYKRGKSVLHVEIPDRISVILVHISGPAVFLSTFLILEGQMLSTPSVLYLLHYAHRVLVYPWLRSKYSKPWPLESVLFFSATNSFCGYILSNSLIFNTNQMSIIIQIILSILFIACAVAAAMHDYYLCSLRQFGESGYRIPSGPLFNIVSCPHYTFELIEWFVFSFFIHPFSVALLFWSTIFLNLTTRATASTIAYRKLFLSKYPQRKIKILPIFYSPVCL